MAISLKSVLALLTWVGIVFAIFSFIYSTRTIRGWNSPGTGPEILRFLVFLFVIWAGARLTANLGRWSPDLKFWIAVFAVASGVLLMDMFSIDQPLDSLGELAPEPAPDWKYVNCSAWEYSRSFVPAVRQSLTLAATPILALIAGMIAKSSALSAQRRLEKSDDA